MTNFHSEDAAFQAEVGGYSQQKTKQIKVVLYADERYAELIAAAFRVGQQVAVAALKDESA